MPTRLSPGQVAIRQASLNTNTFSLDTLAGSIGAVKGIESRGCRLKPSSVFRTSMSLQSEGRGSAVQSSPVVGRSTRSPVSWLRSGTVKRSAGNGPPGGSDRAKSTSTEALCAPANRADLKLVLALEDAAAGATRNASATATATETKIRRRFIDGPPCPAC